MEQGICPCGTGRLYQDCCGPVISGERKASSAMELMRSRYTAYAMADVDYIVNSTHPDQRDSNDKEAIKQWAEKSEWLGFEVKGSEKGGEGDDTGSVEFVASYTDRGVKMQHHEMAEFRRLDGDWYFYDGKIVPLKPFVRPGPKVGRNDACPCGSGKKYKKCCGV